MEAAGRAGRPKSLRNPDGLAATPETGPPHGSGVTMLKLSPVPRPRSLCAAAPLLLAITLLAPITRADERPGSPRRSAAVEVVEKVKASVVNIHSERTVSDSRDPDRR